MHERSDSLYLKWMDTIGKYDYFSCGVSAAFFAYLGEHYSPHRLGMNFQTVELVAIALFAGSFFSGAKRLEISHTLTRGMYRSMLAAERASYCIQQLDNSTEGIPYRKPEDGTICTEQEMRDLQAKYLVEVKEYEASVDASFPRASIWYKRRDFLLFLGFATILLARILQAYAL